MSTISKVKQENNIRAEIPVSFLRFLQSRNDERVLEVVLVYNGVDRYDTIIEPKGLKTDPSIVIVDYNHRQVDTGAYLTNLRVVKDYSVEGIDGESQKLDEALIGDIHIPATAEMFFFDKDGNKKSNGNLYSAVTNGHIKSVSVDFRPKKESLNRKTGVTTYKEWDLMKLSLLDVAPGQQYSGLKVIRYFDVSKAKSFDIKDYKFNLMSNTLNIKLNSEKLESKVRGLVEQDIIKDMDADAQEALIRSITESFEATDEVEKEVTPDKEEAEAEKPVEAEGEEPEASEEAEQRAMSPDDKKEISEMIGRMIDARMEEMEKRLGSYKSKKPEKRSAEEEELEAINKAEESLKTEDKSSKDQNTDNIRMTQAKALSGFESVQYTETQEDKDFLAFKNKVSNNINPYLK